MVEWSSMKECMADAGCSETAIQRAAHLSRHGSSEDSIRRLRSCRCEALADMNQQQKQLDRLDMLIRETNHR